MATTWLDDLLWRAMALGHGGGQKFRMAAAAANQVVDYTMSGMPASESARGSIHRCTPGLATCKEKDVSPYSDDGLAIPCLRARCNAVLPSGSPSSSIDPTRKLSLAVLVPTAGSPDSGLRHRRATRSALLTCVSFPQLVHSPPSWPLLHQTPLPALPLLHLSSIRGNVPDKTSSRFSPRLHLRRAQPRIEDPMVLSLGFEAIETSTITSPPHHIMD